MTSKIIPFPSHRVERDRATNHLAILEQTRPDLSDAERAEHAAYLDNLLAQCRPQIIPFPIREPEPLPDEFDEMYSDPREAQRWREFRPMMSAMLDDMSASADRP